MSLDELELIQKVRDETVTSALTDNAKAKAAAGYSERLNGILCLPSSGK